MTQKQVARIKAHWPLLLIMAAIAGVGWTAHVTLVSAVESGVDRVEQRLEQRVQRVEERFMQRVGSIQKDVRDIRNHLLRGAAFNDGDPR